MNANQWEQFKQQTAERNLKIYHEYLQGIKNMEELGHEYGLTKSRISYIVKAMKKKEVDTIDKV